MAKKRRKSRSHAEVQKLCQRGQALIDRGKNVKRAAEQVGISASILSTYRRKNGFAISRINPNETLKTVQINGDQSKEEVTKTFIVQRLDEIRRSVTQVNELVESL